MAKVFLSYRRDDGAAYAGRLYDRLVSHLGAEAVFMDIDHIEPGEDFVEVIEGTIADSSTLVVIIGPQWATLADLAGSRRLDNPEDFVRLEIAAALARDIRIIPVLVGGARMPLSQELPHSLQPLARRQAVEISDSRFHADVDRLIESIDRILAPTVHQAGEEERASSVAGELRSEDPDSLPSSAEGRPPEIAKARAAPYRGTIKRWIGRFLLLALMGFFVTLGIARMRGQIGEFGHLYINSPDFWEQDIWLIWPFSTLGLGVLIVAHTAWRGRRKKTARES